MIDVATVVKGIKCNLNIEDYRFKNCLHCHYREDVDHLTWSCHDEEMLPDALELLEKMNPRILNPEEIPDYDAAIYLEDIDKSEIIIALYKRNVGNRVEFVAPVHREVIPSYIDYNKRWRAWTARPTEEQRKAVKWDET